MTLRVARWSWPLLFLVPLTLVAGRGCGFPGVDPAYHSVLWLHENLPQIYAVVGLIAVLGVGARVWGARRRADALFELSVEQPAPLRAAFEVEARSLGIGVPPIAYLDVAKPVCFALVGLPASVIVSRGFVADLEPSDLRLVARHELLHLKHHDPVCGFAWHLGFAALILPAFGLLETWLSMRRELRTNLEAAGDNPQAYTELLQRKAHDKRALCAEVFSSAGQPRSLLRALVAPVLVALLFIALMLSHAWFLEHLGFLTSHHC